MNPLDIGVIIVAVLAFSTIGLHIFWSCDKSIRGWLALLILMELPMNGLAMFGVRLPCLAWLKSALGNDTLDAWLTSLGAPLTEEPAKLLPLIFPFFWPRVRQDTLYHVVLSIGLGFGVGEAWTVAKLISDNPEIMKLPWYMLSGFWYERTVVCVVHACMSCVAIWWLMNRKPFWLGYVFAMGIHFLANIPIFLLSKLLFNTPGWFNGIFIQFWFLGTLILLVKLMLNLTAPTSYTCFKKLSGEALCPQCGDVYERPWIMGMNLGAWRYERCAKCKKWNWTTPLRWPSKQKQDEPTNPQH